MTQYPDRPDAPRRDDADPSRTGAGTRPPAGGDPARESPAAYDPPGGREIRGDDAAPAPSHVPVDRDHVPTDRDRVPRDPAGAGEDESLADTVKAQTRSVAEDARQEGADVARRAVEQVKEVAGEAQDRTRALVRETRDEITRQANNGQHRLAGGLRSLSEELRSMADGPQEGIATDIARKMSQQMERAAEFLDRREIGDVMENVRDYARRRPGAYLAGAAAAGVAAGRMTRAARDDAQPIDTDRDRSDTGEMPAVRGPETHFGGATQRPVDTDEVGGSRTGATGSGTGLPPTDRPDLRPGDEPDERGTVR